MYCRWVVFSRKYPFSSGSLRSPSAGPYLTVRTIWQSHAKAFFSLLKANICFFAHISCCSIFHMFAVGVLFPSSFYHYEIWLYCAAIFWVCMFLNANNLTLFRVSSVIIVTPLTQTKPILWPTPSTGLNGGGRALLCPGDWSTMRWTLPWTLDRWDYHTSFCYEQLFTCCYLLSW